MVKCRQVFHLTERSWWNKAASTGLTPNWKKWQAQLIREVISEMLSFNASFTQYYFISLFTWSPLFFFFLLTATLIFTWSGYILSPEIRILLSQSKCPRYCRSSPVLLCIYHSLFYSALGSYKTNFNLPVSSLDKSLKSCGQPGLQGRH